MITPEDCKKYMNQLVRISGYTFSQKHFTEEGLLDDIYNIENSNASLIKVNGKYFLLSRTYSIAPITDMNIVNKVMEI